jgi:hypothetical protein
MSNHTGSYLLNDILSKTLHMGILKIKTKEENIELLKFIKKIADGGDCNIGEIYDGLYEVLNVCLCCGDYNKNLSDQGYCKDCQ